MKHHGHAKCGRAVLAFVLALGLLFGVLTPFGAVRAHASSLTGIGLAEYAWNAYNEGWVYEYGGNGEYDYNGHRQVDCSGFIYVYFTDNGVRAPARGGSQFFNCATDYGYSSDMPRIHGLGLFRDEGHVGIYVGDGMEIDARGDEYDLIYQAVANKWLYWFKVAGISYPTTGWYTYLGHDYYYLDGEYVVDTTMTIDGVSYTFDANGLVVGSGAPDTTEQPPVASDAPAEPAPAPAEPEPAPAAPTLTYAEDTVNYPMQVTDELRLRYGPSTDDAVILNLDAGETVTVLNDDGGWYKVCRADGTVGFASSDFLTAAYGSEPAYTTDELALRTGAGTDYAAAIYLQPQTAVTVLQNLGGWSYVETPENGRGYVSNDYLTTEAPAPSAEPTAEPTPAPTAEPTPAPDAADEPSAEPTASPDVLTAAAAAPTASPKPDGKNTSTPEEVEAAAVKQGEEQAYAMMNDAIQLYLSNDNASVPSVTLPSAAQPEEETGGEFSPWMIAGFCLVLIAPVLYVVLSGLRRPKGEFVGKSDYSRAGRRYRR